MRVDNHNARAVGVVGDVNFPSSALIGFVQLLGLAPIGVFVGGVWFARAEWRRAILRGHGWQRLPLDSGIVDASEWLTLYRHRFVLLWQDGTPMTFVAGRGGPSLRGHAFSSQGVDVCGDLSSTIVVLSAHRVFLAQRLS